MKSGLLLAAAFTLALSACGQKAETPAAPAASTAKGERFTIRIEQLPDMAEVPATVTTRDIAEARARIPGLISSLHVRAGDRVSAGQPVATIADSRLGQEAAAYGAGVAAAEAQAVRARADLERIRFLAREGVYAKAKLDDAVAAARGAEAMLASARAQQGAVRAVEGQGVVRAPAAGVVLAADLPQGSAVSPGMVIATITAGPPIVRLDVPEGIAARLRQGAEVRVSGIARQAGTPSESVGRIVKLYPAVEGGRSRADVNMPGLASGLVGQRVTAAVDLGARDGLVMPARLVDARFGLNFVRLLSADGTHATDVPVEVRPLPDDRVEILSGLKAGDIVLAGPAKAVAR